MEDNLTLMDQFFRVSRLMHHQHHQKNCFNQKESFRGQGRVLTLLYNHPGIHQKELSELLDIRPQSMGEVIMKLERNDFIIRTPDEKDRRAMRIFLTPEGKKAAKFMDTNIREGVKVFDCLNEEEKNHLRQYLSRIIDEIEKTTDTDKN
ncbi:MarR family winged helix-turn-helix transcriptional regulator [Anaerotignum sp.]|uniref:MarR family winged helix-turn-helix transcriptional regulator n=1 Tax=Anaerotignum sp. TaxID=2039241 RepID=UPI0027145D0F|nr:MarR family transcriptional regulator [Anaerotignum sp.]